ncbi:MAG: hypothetical protein KJ676_04390 [Alphaproteobacteria bacterium]|nr:hypothetical protein [Alphaproteobacteria bacterium]MBU1527148.1 hypothetical protein [Alphaproteobacteria bacterium]MBU2117215.1 hypothetical protein [Alphaproteobacteria bacterium]MBU2350656.1 hypothetical protein [Alphaproteobacteria bacterium]MBU2383273.1 hypothetical protein [Alphaproteobacteria bacterium]
MTEDRPLPLPLRLAGMAVLAGTGAVTGGLVARVVDDGGVPPDDALNLFIAVVLIAMAAISAGVLALRPSRYPKGCGVLQVVVMALAGIMLLVPLYATRWISSELAFGLVLALLAVQTFANLLLWRRADEMLRRIMVETGSLAFWTLQLALFLYASGERLGLTDGVTAWGMIAVLMAVYLVASAIVAARRGLK